jgi:CheY-like chemotaxis protein
LARILIVDDEQMERLQLAAILEGAGHELLFAKDGRGALESFNHGVYYYAPIDLVITDIAMPRLNGLQLIREIRKRGYRVPIIAVSGVSAEQLDLAEDFGADSILYKPLDPEKLAAAVEQELDPRKTRPPDFLKG